MIKLILLTSAAIIELLPIVFIKEYTSSFNLCYFFLIILCYIILIALYINICKMSDIADSYTFLQIVQILVIVVIGIFYYKETMDITKAIGVTLALIAAYLLVQS